MSWVRLDDQFPIHRKVELLSDPAFRLHLSAICWCARHLTDGRVPLADLDTAAPKTMRRAEKFVTELVRRGIWVEHDWGWEIHDYLDYQFSRDRTMRERKRNANRTALHRDPEVINAVRMRDGDVCRYCGQTVNWMDRRSTDGGTYNLVDPGGPNSVDNLVVSCRGCNARKRDHAPEQVGLRLRPPGGERVLDTDLARTKYFSGPVPVPEPVKQTEGDTSPSASPRVRLGPEFDEFYAAYPRHVGRKAAERAWTKAIKDGADAAAIIAGAKRYAGERHGQDMRFTKHPATWLNAGCWDDEPLRERSEPAVSESDARIARFLRGSERPEPPHPPPRQIPRGGA